MVIKIGINGFGRIGRVIFRTCLENTDIEVAAINDPAISVEYICYLIKFDSTHGKFKGSVTYTQNIITVNGKQVKIFNLKQPSIIPWHEARVQYVVEASGMFTSLEKASGHLTSEYVKCVIITSPSVDAPMIILGVNDVQINKGQILKMLQECTEASTSSYTVPVQDKEVATSLSHIVLNLLNISDTNILSCASSTLYCLAPIIKVLEDNFGVAEGFVTSIHAMTPSLKPLDGLCVRGKHWRDHRSIHQNIIPASTGACKALGKIIPRLQDCLSGLAFRVPIVNVSVLDISIRLSKCTTLSQIVRLVNKANESTLKNIIRTSTDEAVSSDFMDETHSCILDVNSCLQLKPDFFKLVCWYENEYSYACRVIDTIRLAEERFNCTFVRPRMTLPRSRISSLNSVKNNNSNSKGLSFAQSVIQSKILLTPKDEEIKQKIAIYPTTSETPLTFSLSTPKDIITGLGNRGTINNNELNQKSVIYPATSNKPLTSLSTLKDIPTGLGYGETKNSNELRQKSAIYPSTTKMPLTSSLSTPQDIPSGLGYDRTKNSNEIFRLWNADDPKTNIPVVQDNSNLFRSCMEFTPSLPLGTEYNQSRLEKVKAEFSKMANITEHLLRKSQSNKVKCNCLSVNSIQEAKEVLFGKKNNEADKDDNNVSKIEIDKVVTKEKVKDSESTIKTEGVTANTPQTSAHNDNTEFDECKITKMVVDSKSPNKCNEDAIDKSDITINELSEVTIKNTDVIDEEMKYNCMEHVSFYTYLKNSSDTEYMKGGIKESKIIVQKSKITQNIEEMAIELSKASNSHFMKRTSSEEYQGTLTSSSGDLGEKSANLVSTFHEDRQSLHSMKQRQEDNKSTHSDSDNETIRFANDTTSFGLIDSILISDIEYNKEIHEMTYKNAQGKITEETVLEQQIIVNADEVKSKTSIFQEVPETAEDQIVIGTEEVDSKMSILEEQPLEAKEFLMALNSRSSVIIVPLEESQPSENEPIASNATNIAIKRYKKDIYDKLSSSGTESEQSFGVNGKKSEVISIKDLTNSLEDLERLDKICKIIEISDDLSDRLFSPLDRETDSINQKKWSFKDLCNRIKLDEFCDKVFSK